MKAVTFVWALALLTFAATNDCRGNEAKLPLHVLYLSRQQDAERSEAFTEFLGARFAKCVTARRDDFRPELLVDIDVVLLDWSYSERPLADAPSPLGPLEEWSTPLVLLGSAGLLQAQAWGVIGSAG